MSRFSFTLYLLRDAELSTYKQLSIANIVIIWGNYGEGLWLMETEYAKFQVDWKLNIMCIIKIKIIKKTLCITLSNLHSKYNSLFMCYNIIIISIRDYKRIILNFHVGGQRLLRYWIYI